MEEKKPNFFRVILFKLQSWYRARRVRKVFLIGLGVAVLFLLVAQVEKSGVASYGAIAAGIICIGASIGDTWISSKEFKRFVKEVQQKYFVRLVEKYGDGAVHQAPPCFSAEDKKVIRRKKASFRGTIFLKVVFMFFLIALLFKDMI